MKINFTGIIPPYVKNNILIYPIEKDISPADIQLLTENANDQSQYIGERHNGLYYHLGEDLVIKKNKNSSENSDVLSEAKNLDILYEFCQEGHSLDNCQKGIAAFKLPDGQSYLVSTKVDGEKLNCQTNPLTKENLKSVVSIITELDKGSEKYGRLMTNDFNFDNIKYTPANAGFMNFEYMEGRPLDDNIENTIINKNYDLSPYTSDTSYLESNLRSFEFSTLVPYLLNDECQNPEKLFEEYLKIKSNYHNEMGGYFIKKAKNSRHKNIIHNIYVSERVQSRLLSQEPISKDIKISEVRKMQMAAFIFNLSKLNTNPAEKFNPNQVVKYYKKSLKYFKKNYQRALRMKDYDRLTYYGDCIEIFEKWAPIQTLKENLDKSLISRITKDKSNTLEKKIV